MKHMLAVIGPLTAAASAPAIAITAATASSWTTEVSSIPIACVRGSGVTFGSSGGRSTQKLRSSLNCSGRQLSACDRSRWRYHPAVCFVEVTHPASPFLTHASEYDAMNQSAFQFAHGRARRRIDDLLCAS